MLMTVRSSLWKMPPSPDQAYAYPSDGKVGTYTGSRATSPIPWMINVSLGLSGGTVVVVGTVVVSVVVSTSRVVAVVVGEDLAEVVGGVVAVLVVVVVANSAARRVDKTADVEEGVGGRVVATGASVLGAEGAALTVLSRLSAEEAEEPHAAAPTTIQTKSTAICGLLGRLTLWLRNFHHHRARRTRDLCDSAILTPELSPKRHLRYSRICAPGSGKRGRIAAGELRPAFSNHPPGLYSGKSLPLKPRDLQRT